MNLLAMFPTGEWDRVLGKFMVRRGSYYWVAAESNQLGEVTLTDFGRQFAKPVVESASEPTPEPTPVVVPKAPLKRTGKKASVSHDLDDLEL